MQDYLRVQLEFLYVVAYRQHFELMLIFTLSLEFCHSYMPFRHSTRHTSLVSADLQFRLVSG